MVNDMDDTTTTERKRSRLHFQMHVEEPPEKGEQETPEAGQPAAAAPAGLAPGGRGQRKSCMEEESMRERMHSSLLRDCTHILQQEENKYCRDSLRRVFQDKEFLEKLFQLFDQERNNYLVQEDWVEFLKARLTDEKQGDLAEQLESVCYVLCGEGPVTPERFAQLFQAKGIVDKVFRLIDRDNDGSATPAEVVDFIAAITNTRPRTGFDKSSLERLERVFRQTVGDQNEIRREDFQKIVISKNPFFTERVFQIFDKDNSGAISLQEFLDAMHQFAGQSPEDKIRFLFKVYDLDGDGLIQQRELRHVLRACMEENGMKFNETQLADLADALLEDADPSGRGAITYEALRSQLYKHGGLLENLTISIDRWLVPPKPAPPPASRLGRLRALRPYQLSAPYIRNNYVYLLFLGAFVLVNAGLFISRSIQYRHSNGYVIMARACGQCLNFNCTWVLVLMLRRCITFLRTRGLGLVLPLDQHIYLHKLTGMLIFVLSLSHTLMHLLNFSIEVVNDPVVNAGNFTISDWLLTAKPGLFGLLPGCANPTGFALLAILIVMFVCSQAFVRRGGSFEIFYWTHLLYLPFWVILAFHGPNFWRWFLVPGLLYFFERLSRLALVAGDAGRTYVSSGLLLPSRVTHLVIRRPPHFHYHPGDYVFVRIPAIAKYEWHPFTISSAPEQEEHVWLHVRGVGQWTNRLHAWFESERERLHAGDVPPLVPAGALLGDLRSEDNEGFVPDEGPRLARGVSALTLLHKAPLEKALSVPDMQTRSKKRERLVALREYARSESEKSFDECQVRRAHLQALGLAYLSPQNRALAQSFRYMRTKPTIIAFKTPSLEQCSQRDSTASMLTLARRRLSKTLNPDKDKDKEKDSETGSGPEPGATGASGFVNYPVGKPLEIFMDGPYGAPSSHIFRAQHAVLVGTGIGVTPFASILQSIMHRYWKARHRCPRCKHTWAGAVPTAVMHLRKVDFFWINREQRSFEWFVSLLSQLEMEQAELGGAMERFLDMHMYITSALQRADMKAVGLQLALDLLHAKEKRDLITGLKTRTNAGRPNWDKVFKQIKDQDKGKVTVFYCGPPQLARVLRVKCDQFGFSFRKEAF